MYIWCAAIAGINDRGKKLMTAFTFQHDSYSEREAESYLLDTICPVEFAHLKNIQVVLELVPMEWIEEIALERG